MKRRGRPPLPIPTTRISISLPVHIADWLRKQANDPMSDSDRLKYGVLSDYITCLIRKDMREKESS